MNSRIERLRRASFDAKPRISIERAVLVTEFYKKDLAAGTLDRAGAKEMLSCFWIKFNNHPAPPKVGVTARESGTYNDFTNINLGGLTRDGRDASNELSYMILEILDELHLLQPQCNVQISCKTQVRMGKSIEDAREGGCSGCIETGAFGKEAYILTGYLNVPKILELALNKGVDPLSGRQAGLPESDGTSPSHGADRNGPTAVIKSLSKMDQVKSGGTLLNMRFLPDLLAAEKDLDKLAGLVRTYFRLNGHHIQFNIVDTDILRRAQAAPDEYRNLLVRVAGYSDYFTDLDSDHQQEIIDRTGHDGF
ncbi:MAG: hypothetical protein B6I22_12470 [Desulfobacteraceae bacterium 4572_123]|nr:MAG: hypothetical protein B6I22_12470 [Desulfobacteraceae bacterium 4572_123]